MKKINLNKVQQELLDRGIRLFSVLEFKQIFEVSYESAKKSIIRYVRNSYIIKAKKGLYFLKSNPPSDFELANRLYHPSYISLDTAMSYYGIIPETIYEITSVTTRPGRQFEVADLIYSFKHIKKDCFCGYAPKNIRQATILIAEPEKALADYFYFVALGKKDLSYERIKTEKVDYDSLTHYINCFGNQKAAELAKNLRNSH